MSQRFKYSRYRAIVKKEIIQIRKDPASLAIALILPVMLLFLLGYAVISDFDHVQMAVWDQSQTKESRELVDSFTNSGYFHHEANIYSYDEMENLLNRGKIRSALIIPADYANDLKRESASIQFIVDGSDPTVAETALSNSALIIQNQAIELQKETFMQRGEPSIPPPLKGETRVFYNLEMEVLKFNIPALIGLIMQEVTLLLTAFALVREKERGTMEQLIVTPIKRSELILGKLTPYIGIGIFSFLFVLVTGIYWFGVPVEGSVPLLLAFSMLFLITTLAMGMLISTIAKNQLQAMHMAFAVILPSVILSGFIFPREPMPLIIQGLGGLIPLTYFIEMLRGVFLKGVGIEYLWQQTLILAGFTIALCVVTILRFNKKLE